MKMQNVINLAKSMVQTFKAKSVFKSAGSAVRKASSIQAMKNDPLVKTSRAIFNLPGVIGNRASSNVKKAWASTASAGGRQFVKKASRRAGAIGSSVGRGGINGLKKVGPMALLGVGAVGMMSVGIMNGINNASKDIVLERYMSDQRFARDILLQSRVGLSMGTNKMNRLGSTTGLSNALSKTRHGAQY